jgi:TonB family protein
MAPYPRPEPDSSQPVFSSTESFRTQPEDPGLEADFAELAARFSAQSGGGLSPELAGDLALEIVLNQMVEQACLATGATGAAIVLRRGGEMVCRATSGATAPELGSRLDTSSGLSGECVRTLRTQRCDDVVADTRADIDASMRLGVRSVIVMPLLRGAELLGVIELFSPRPAAFGDRDERTLEALASRVLDNFERTARPPTPVEMAPASGYAETFPENLQTHTSGDEISAETAENAQAGGFNFVTLALGAAIVACAALLGVVLGRHLAVEKASVRMHRATSSAATVNAAPAAGAAAAANPSPSNKTEEAPQPAASSQSRVTDSVPPGGLRVYENGKEIFRMPPTPGQSAATASQETGVQPAASLDKSLASEKSEQGEELPAAWKGELLYRVEPEYPEEAREQKIEGAVVMEVHIATDGTVEDVRLLSGPPQLMQAAADAVTRWRFQPRTSHGHPVKAQTRVTLNFRLPQ